MENIIQHFCTKNIKEIWEKALSVVTEQKDFSALVEGIKGKTDQLICTYINGNHRSDHQE